MLAGGSTRCAARSTRPIAAVTDDLDKFRFNRAVARIRELTNALEDMPDAPNGAGAVLREGLEAVTRLIGPMMPHLAEEMWQALGHRATLLAETPWPKADPDLARDETVTDRGAGQRQAARHARPAARRAGCRGRGRRLGLAAR